MSITVWVTERRSWGAAPLHPVGAPTKGGHGEPATHGFGYSEAFDPVKPNGTQQTDCNFFQDTKRNKSVKDEALEAKTVSVLNM